jgi:FkbM family methyltransferase
VALAALVLRVRPWVSNAAGRRIYVDREDHRAWRMAIHRGALDADAIRIWKQLVEWCQPDLVLDVGANYGEVVLSTSYPRDADVHVFEPNPKLLPHLRRSLAATDLGATVHPVAVTTTTGTAALNIDPRSSGNSSLEPRQFDTRPLTVDTAPLDELVPGGHQRCVFKIDVEGAEPKVWASMTDTLAGCARWCGVVEYRNHADHIDLDEVPYSYAVRLGDYSYEPTSDEVLARVDADEHGYVKDIVLSSEPLPV